MNDKITKKKLLSNEIKRYYQQNLDDVLDMLADIDPFKDRDDLRNFLMGVTGLENSIVSSIINDYCLKLSPASNSTIVTDKTITSKSTNSLGGVDVLPASQNNLRSTTIPQKQRGKAKNNANSAKQINRKACGCFATLHNFCTSCGFCGRIFCIEEGLGKCFFCDRIVQAPVSYAELEVKGATKSILEAYAQKDKLLQFDKENAQRTKSLDAQGDYYESSVWLSETERQRLEERMEQQRKKAGRKPLRIAFDIAGRRIITVDEDENDDNNGSCCDILDDDHAAAMGSGEDSSLDMEARDLYRQPSINPKISVDFSFNPTLWQGNSKASHVLYEIQNHHNQHSS